MGTYEVEQTIKQFGHALTRLEEALTRSAEYDDIVIDATIQRFEFTIELCWKALIPIAKSKPRSSTREFQSMPRLCEYCSLI